MKNETLIAVCAKQDSSFSIVWLFIKGKEDSGDYGAGDNRDGGFKPRNLYLHYKDVFDLLEKVELELLDELGGTLQKYQASDLHQKLSLIFTDLFVCVQENAEMVQILLGKTEI